MLRKGVSKGVVIAVVAAIATCYLCTGALAYWGRARTGSNPWPGETWLKRAWTRYGEIVEEEESNNNPDLCVMPTDPWVTDWEWVIGDPYLPDFYVTDVSGIMVQGQSGSWLWDWLNNQPGTVTIPGMGKEQGTLYSGVNLKLYAESNPQTSLTLGQNVQISNGYISGVQGLRISTTPLTVNLSSSLGFSGGTWYTGTAKVTTLIETHTGLIPEPSSFLAVAGAAVGLLRINRRRRS